MTSKDSNFIRESDLIGSGRFFKLLFIGFLFAYLPFGLFIAFLSLFNIMPVNFNEKEIYGVTGFIISVIYIPFTGLIFASLNWIFLSIGLWIFLKTKSVINSIRR